MSSTKERKTDSNKRFGEWLHHCRIKQNVTLEILGDGICSTGMINFLERGTKNSGKQLRSRLLARLGVCDDEYETYLGLEEYEEWSLQQSICRRLTDGQIAEATAELEQYGKQYDITVELNGFQSEAENNSVEAPEESAACICRLRKQFYLGMLGMLYRLQGAEPKLLAAIYREAVMLTMPDVEKKPVEQMALSVRELNLLLEASYWEQQSGQGKNAIMGANQVMRYIASHTLEDKLSVKIYAKAAYYYCREVLLEEEKDDGDVEQAVKHYVQAFLLCNEAIELLRKTARMYYLWELLQISEQLVEELQKQNFVKAWEQEVSEKERQNILDRTAQNRIWKLTVQQLYEELQMPAEQGVETYLYIEQDTFCINDVIRKRRKMLGMSRQELCENICSIDTLRRLEIRQKTTQVGIVRELCRRLRLPEEYERTELVTADLEAHELEKKICDELNNYSFEESLKLIEQLEKRLEMSEPINRQWIDIQKSIALRYLRKISDTEYQACLLQALGYTLRKKALDREQITECYLTNSEIQCIYHIALIKKSIDNRESFERIKPLYRLCKTYEENGVEINYIGNYELCMSYIGSLLYYLQKFDEVKEVSIHTGRMCLSMRRAFCLDSIMYNLLCWKIAVIKNEGNSPDEERKKGLIFCHNLSLLFRNEVLECFFESRLRET